MYKHRLEIYIKNNINLLFMIMDTSLNLCLKGYLYILCQHQEITIFSGGNGSKRLFGVNASNPHLRSPPDSGPIYSQPDSQNINKILESLEISAIYIRCRINHT